MAKFKCIASGEVYEFTAEHDIKSMRSHPEYQEVVEIEEPAKKVGRPKQVLSTVKEAAEGEQDAA